MCVASAHGDFLPRISFSTDRDPELSILPRIARKRRSTGTRHHLPDTSAPGEQKEIFKQSPWGFNSTFFREYEKNLDPSLLRIFVLETMLQTIGYGPARPPSAYTLRRLEDVLMAVADGPSWFDQCMKNSGVPIAGIPQPDLPQTDFQ
jgi:hypothetical protein